MILGTEKQEHKILEMGEIGHKMFPKFTLMNFKGAFRLGIQSALQKSGYTTWKELAEKNKTEKEHFFEFILEGTKPYLKSVGLIDSEIEDVYKTIKTVNQQYLKG